MKNYPTAENYKIITSEYLIKRPWLTARKDKVLLPNGHINPEYYVLEYPDWINIIARTNEGRYLMINQYRHGLGCAGIELVAGVIEKGESPEDAAKRELMEETGYSGGKWNKLMTISPNPSTSTNLVHCYFADGVEQTAPPTPEETEDLKIFTLSELELLELMKSGKIVQALMLAPLWRFFYEKLNTSI